MKKLVIRSGKGIEDNFTVSCSDNKLTEYSELKKVYNKLDIVFFVQIYQKNRKLNCAY